MRRVAIAVLAASLLTGCITLRLVSDYDEVVDKGISDIAERLNTHVKDMGELAGKPEGTYERNFGTYNALESKLDVLIGRTSAASQGMGCKIETKLFQRISALLSTNIPPDLKEGSDANPSTSSACNARLLVLVKDQLSGIREIHKTGKCGDQSCFRPAAAKDALAIANQSINAALIVEAAKKSN